MHSRGHVYERPSGPDGGVQRGKLVVARGNHRSEIFGEKLGMFFQSGVRVEEDHALLFEVLTNLVVHDLGFILGRDSRNEARTLGLGNAQPFVSVADVLGQVLPGLRLTLGGSHEILDVVEVDSTEVRAEIRHRLTLEDFERLQASLTHPIGFVFESGDFLDDCR